MSGKKKSEGQSGGIHIHISGDSATVGDVVGRDKKTHSESVTIRDTGAGAVVTVGRDAPIDVAQPFDLVAVLAEWKTKMGARIDAQPALSPDDRSDLKEQVEKIQAEAAKGEQADPGRLERLINTLGVMASDIFDVAVATLVNPLGGIGLALKKIGDKAKLERQAEPSESPAASGDTEAPETPEASEPPGAPESS